MIRQHCREYHSKQPTPPLRSFPYPAEIKTIETNAAPEESVEMAAVVGEGVSRELASETSVPGTRFRQWLRSRTEGNQTPLGQQQNSSHSLTAISHHRAVGFLASAERKRNQLLFDNTPKRVCRIKPYPPLKGTSIKQPNWWIRSGRTNTAVAQYYNGKRKLVKSTVARIKSPSPKPLGYLRRFNFAVRLSP